MATLFNTASLNGATRFARQNFMPVNFRGTLRENSIENVPHPEGTPANSSAAGADDVSQSERIRQKTGNFWLDLITPNPTQEDIDAINRGTRDDPIGAAIGATADVANFAAWADVQRVAFLFIGIVSVFVGMWSLASPGVKDTISSVARAN